MFIEQFINCECGVSKHIKWSGFAEFESGLSSFCVGYSECSSCSLSQLHYSGNPQDFVKFSSFLKKNTGKDSLANQA